MKTTTFFFVLILIFNLILAFFGFLSFGVFDRLIENDEHLKLILQIIGGVSSILISSYLAYFYFEKQLPVLENKERRMKVFDEMVKNYLEFIEMTIDDLEFALGDIEDEESELKIEKIRKNLYIKIYPFIDEKSFSAIQESIRLLCGFEKYEAENRKIVRGHILNIVFQLKRELKIQNESDSDVTINNLNQIDEIFEDFKKKKSVGTDNLIFSIKKDFGNININNIKYWHFILYDSIAGKKDLADGYLRLWDGKDESDNRSRFVQENVKKDDLLFVYSRGWGYIAIVIAISDGDRKGLNGGWEGFVKVENIAIVENEKAIPRDQARIRTIQRINEPKNLLEKFIMKCNDNKNVVEATEFLEKLRAATRMPEEEKKLDSQ